MADVDLGFSGEVAGLYHQYRHGYPAATFDVLVDAFRLSDHDVAVDLGCGTGQLTLPMAGRVRAVLGVDPEPDMLRRARRAAQDEGLSNVTWMIGADTDVPALRALLGDRSTGVVTIGQALHWMRHEELFRALVPLIRAGGGVAVVTNGTPLWLQQSAWSRALRAFLERWLETELTFPCGTDEQSQRRYQEALAAAGFEVSTTAVDYVAELDLDQLVGGVYSALSPERLPAPEQRPDFADQIRAALSPHDQFSEPVHVAIIIGRSRLPQRSPVTWMTPQFGRAEPEAAVPFDRAAKAVRGAFDGGAAEAGIQDKCFDILMYPQRPVHLGLDIVIQRVLTAGLSQFYERHGGCDSEVDWFAEAIGVAERCPGHCLRADAQVRRPETGRASGRPPPEVQ